MKKTILILFSSFLPLFAHAQMFSVQSGSNKPISSATYIRVGMGINDFSFTGNPNASDVVDRLDFAHNSFSAYFESEDSGIELGLNIANRLVGLKNMNLFDLSLYYTNVFYLLNRSKVKLGFPLRGGTELVNIASTEDKDKFTQTAITIGAGAHLSLKFNDYISFTNQFLPGYGFSTSSGGFFGGAMGYWMGRSRLNIANVFGDRGLSIGYDFKQFMFDIDGNKFDYDLTTHFLTIGISI